MTDSRIAKTANGSISYREAGEGPALLLMHGVGGNARSWREQLDGLADRFRVIAWDAPGYGQSARRAPTLEAYGGAVADLLGALGIARAHVLGHSMGGIIAQAAAGLHPERVEKLVLSGTFTGDAEPAGTPLSDGWQARLDDIETMSSEAFGAARAAGMVAPGASEAVRSEAASIAAEVTRDGLHDGCYLLHHADTRPLAEGLSMPVLAIVGAADRIIPPARSADMTALIRDCRTVEIPGAGHAAYLEAPDAYNAALTEFLG